MQDHMNVHEHLEPAAFYHQEDIQAPDWPGIEDQVPHVELEYDFNMEMFDDA